ncbi:NAD(P)-binding protein [Xylona heveae TC161]|uniref:NAD(P)-binding protein n=1 Tax=Xylona heveae (strain CBS 132557 / TC161) TaxID=1328760 RepID=A0A165HCJ5_XYLHT|nr:NAD(P)-binding protein [Xylona heveae TC161]KZF23300.1 NAD(P)-binding protein [Xylona heveae TC161]
MAQAQDSKVVLVTAGSAGLGAAVVKALAAAGQYRIVVNYSSNRERAEDLIKEIEKAYPSSFSSTRFAAIQADVSKRDEIIRLVEKTVSTMGRLDAIVSNAGWTRFSNFLDLDESVVESDWDKCFNMNVKSHLFLMHAAKKHLEATEGAFLLTASTAGVIPAGSSMAYSVSKAAEIHLMKCLAKSTGPRIRVNSVSPGLMLTDWGLQFPQEQINAYKEQTKLKSIPAVEDVAQQVLCFIQNRSITGANIVIDSGYTV